MSDYGHIDGAALDRYITGNYGEDQADSYEYEDFAAVEAQLTDSGYEHRVPSPDCEMDRAIVERETCFSCGARMTFVPFTRGRSYRAFAVCRACNTATEF